MNKLEVQKLITKDGQPLDLDKFEWCEETKIFSSDVEGLVINLIDFDDISQDIYICKIKNCDILLNDRQYSSIKNNLEKHVKNVNSVYFKERVTWTTYKN
jgi:hypothetical protein